jgi:hypothetical protein
MPHPPAILRILPGLLLGLMLAFLTGCHPAREDALDLVVQGRTAAEYRQWLYRHRARLDPIAQRELQTSIQQMTLRIQIERAGLSPDEISRTAYSRINGLSVREIITQSHLWRWRALAEQNEIDERLFERNASFPLTPDADDLIVQRFRDQLHDIRLRQQQRQLEMRFLEARLLDLNPDYDVTRLLHPAAPSDVPRAVEL